MGHDFDLTFDFLGVHTGSLVFFINRYRNRKLRGFQKTNYPTRRAGGTPAIGPGIPPQTGGTPVLRQSIGNPLIEKVVPPEKVQRNFSQHYLLIYRLLGFGGEAKGLNRDSGQSKAAR